MNPSPAKTPRYTRTKVALPKQDVIVYAGKYVGDALRVIDNSSLYEGVKLLQLLEAMYEQGKKDGARNLFDKLDALKGHVPHRNPGQPKKLKRQAGSKMKK